MIVENLNEFVLLFYELIKSTCRTFADDEHYIDLFYNISRIDMIKTSTSPEVTGYVLNNLRSRGG